MIELLFSIDGKIFDTRDRIERSAGLYGLQQGTNTSQIETVVPVVLASGYLQRLLFAAYLAGLATPQLKHAVKLALWSSFSLRHAVLRHAVLPRWAWPHAAGKLKEAINRGLRQPDLPSSVGGDLEQTSFIQPV
jgi:hypothetical protein